MSLEQVEKLAKNLGGKIDYFSGPLQDGSGFATMSMPLPKDHWLTIEGHNEPPAPMRMGTDNPERKMMREKLILAGRYAVRTATMNGKDDDFDPDALIQNLIIGMLGYHTYDGLSHIDE